MSIRIKRAYAPPAPEDGRRVLVDGIWPRGIRREDLKIDAWVRDIAPSRELRAWFGHDPERWPGFRERYREELRRAGKAELLNDLAGWAGSGDLTLVFAARDEAHNNAAVLEEVMEDRLRRP